MSESATNSIALDTLDNESDIVQEFAAQPAQRKAFVNAAKYFDSVGDEQTASSLHNGVVPSWLIEKYSLQSYPAERSGLLDSCLSLGWYPAQSERLQAPVNKDKNRNSVFLAESKECPPEFLNLLTNGSLVYDGVNRLFVDPLNRRVSDHSDVNSYLCHALAGDISHAKEKLAGLSLLLSARNAGNFYHWHFDILPALGLVEECGIKIGDIDNIILTSNEASFHLQMLKNLGVSEEQIKIVPTGYHHIRCEKLLLPTIRNGMGMRQPRKHIDWLRTKFLSTESVGKSMTAQPKIAVIRDKRGYTNNELVSEKLRQHGYWLFKPEEHSYVEQVRIFQQATHVISPHGAGLSLLAYCSPGTVVHEFYGEHIHPCFWSLSSTLGLKYYNYNCSHINQASVTNSGRGMVERLGKSIDVSAELLNSLQNI